MNWRWKPYSELSLDELYAILALRERVFIVEQNCPYQDADGSDPRAWHLAGYQGATLVAYLRAFPPGVKYAEASFGRVVTAPEHRRTGAGKQLLREALARMAATFGEGPIRISAQSYLKDFYAGFDFVREGEEYLEDGIPHVAMRRAR